MSGEIGVEDYCRMIRVRGITYKVVAKKSEEDSSLNQRTSMQIMEQGYVIKKCRSKRFPLPLFSPASFFYSIPQTILWSSLRLFIFSLHSSSSSFVFHFATNRDRLLCFGTAFTLSLLRLSLALNPVRFDGCFAGNYCTQSRPKSERFELQPSSTSFHVITTTQQARKTLNRYKRAFSRVPFSRSISSYLSLSLFSFQL